jgi:tetratricopeptide (TPR) repeat protein
MAWVYLAEDIKDNRLVAVKVLYPQFGEDLSYIHRFNREAKLASAMTDPHIVRVLDYGADRDIYYLVMEYIEGRDLRQILAEKGPYPWRSAFDILDQLATALEHAHGHGVVHRDIKPQNLMMQDNGTLKVLDFGIARISTLPSLTQSGFIGSPYYVSPEQAMSEEVDIRSDIYSAGIVLYEMLSGRIPFDAKSPWSIISQHIANDPPPIELAESDAPDTVHQVLLRMMAKSREERFQTPTALRRAIAASLAGKPIPDQALDTRPISVPDQIDMAESLFHRAMEAVEAEEWGRACDLLNQTLKLNPDHRQAQAQLKIAEQNNTLASNYSTAVRAMDRKAWQEALDKFKVVVEAEASYKDAQARLKQCEEMVAKQTHQQTVAVSYAEGISHFEAERWSEAITAFQEVQRLSPGYKRTEQLLAEADRLSKPSLWSRAAGLIRSPLLREGWGRWGLLAVGLLVIVVTFIILGNGNQATGDDRVKEQLKEVYAEAQQALAQEDTAGAIALLEEILAQDPDYADAAELRRELVSSLTPTPSAQATLQAMTAENPLLAQFSAVEKGLGLEEWDETIALLETIRATDRQFEASRVSSLFCDALIGRGLETLTMVRQQRPNEPEIVKRALDDFKAGAAECPRRIDLQDQANRASAYLEALSAPQGDYEPLIKILTPIVAADPNYVNGHAKDLLYSVYLKRGDARNKAGEIVGALGDYEAALALNVPDPSQAQIRRAQLILAFQQSDRPVELTLETPQPETTPVPTGSSEPTPTATPDATPGPVQITLKEPTLLSPDENTVFAGKYAEVVVSWEAAPLAQGEYFDLTVMHIFGDGPRYWGLPTRDTTVKLPPDIGVGTAGNDTFYWWVTIRQANTAPSADALDLPRSPQSAARTFVWVP